MEDGRYNVLLLIVDTDKDEVLLNSESDEVVHNFVSGLSSVGEEWLATSERLLRDKFALDVNNVSMKFVRHESVTSASKSSPTCWNTYVVLCTLSNRDCINVGEEYSWFNINDVDLKAVSAQCYLYLKEALEVLSTECQRP